MPDSHTATIGPKTFVKGKIQGEDDLVIKGRVEGTVKLPKNRVQIAKGSEVKADITARSIEVEGLVRGKITGLSDVAVLASGRVEGDVVASRIRVEAGAHIDGSVDMHSAESPTKPAQSSKQAQGGT